MIRMPGSRVCLELQAESEKNFGQADYMPNITVTFWTFRIMVGLGFLMILVAMIAIFLAFRKKPIEKVKLLWIFVPMVAAPYLANTAGWLLTEMGRQPWVVFGQMLTRNAGTPMLNEQPWMVITTLAGFFLVYGILIVIDVFLLVKYSKKVPGESTYLDGSQAVQNAGSEVTK